MSTTDEVTQDQQSGDESQGAQWRKKLEDRAVTAEARVKELERSVAFNSVKELDLSNPQHKFFAEHYSGDMTPDAVKEAFTANGFSPVESKSEPVTPTEDPSITAEREQLARFDAASNGATPSPAAGTQAEEAFKQAMSANSRQDFWAKARAAGVAQ